ncbi:uncharacterized protein LOC113274816 [Papaver somniferum]|uniref:uncharacterized protein LOC113274816 n=1 Tax=Papaver somniferum TaxID=3469 RepID=UPI000E6F5380|nr:uncharacterized protein LOC113274816 [Papaver somniferum]
MGGETESSTKGKSTNYDEWARAIRRSLIAKRKFGFFDGTITEPEDCDQLEEWIAVQSMFVSWISNTLEPSIRSSLGDYDNANLMWTHLKRRFCVVSGTRICQLKASLSECKQKNKEGVAVYFGGLNKIWDELVTYVKVPQCKCGKCDCNIASQLLARDPLPSIDVAYQTMVNSERLRIGDVAMSTELQENVMAFRVQSDQQWWGDRPRGGRGNGRGGRAGGRGRAGFANVRGGRGQGNGNQVRAHNLNISEMKYAGGACSSDVSGLTGVTATQFQKVIEFLNTRKSTSQLQAKKTVWIVDTWATNHVTCKRDDMIDVRDIKACSVGLPDGKYAHSEKIGTVILPGGLRLENMLYVPQITFEVMAVSGNTYELWHRRMGHPSEKVLQSKEIKIVRSDNGTEFNALRGYFRTNGIVFETSCVGTPQQNGRVERKHQHIMNVARSLRFQSNLPIYFWGECALDAAYLINRTPTLILNNKTTYEILFGKQPPYNQLKVFGCLCYVHDQGSNGDKFAIRGRRCVFLGYPFGKKSWKVYDLDARRFLVSRDVKFCEYQFPYRTDLKGDLTETVQLGSDPSTEKDQSNSGGSETAVDDPAETESTADTETDMPSVLTGTENSDDCGSVDVNEGDTLEQPVEDVNPSNDTTSAEELGKGRFSAVHKKYLAALTAGSEPQNFKEAMKHPGWRKAMEAEI